MQESAKKPLDSVLFAEWTKIELERSSSVGWMPWLLPEFEDTEDEWLYLTGSRSVPRDRGFVIRVLPLVMILLAFLWFSCLALAGAFGGSPVAGSPYQAGFIVYHVAMLALCELALVQITKLELRSTRPPQLQLDAMWALLCFALCFYVTTWRWADYGATFLEDDALLQQSDVAVRDTGEPAVLLTLAILVVGTVTYKLSASLGPALILHHVIPIWYVVHRVSFIAPSPLLVDGAHSCGGEASSQAVLYAFLLYLLLLLFFLFHRQADLIARGHMLSAANVIRQGFTTEVSEGQSEGKSSRVVADLLAEVEQLKQQIAASRESYTMLSDMFE